MDSTVRRKIMAGNPWYLDNQVKIQLGTRGGRMLIENRWQIFGRMIEEWRQRSSRPSRLALLDAGCGDGINLRGLREIEKQGDFFLSITACDYNPLRLEKAKNADPAADLHEVSLENMNFGEGKFDAILCSHVLEHIPAWENALACLRYHLKSGGLLIIAVPNEGCLMGRIRNHVMQRSILKKTDHVHFFTETGLRKKISTSGFSVLRVEHETFFFPHSWINQLVGRFCVGQAFMNFLRKAFPSQAGGLIFACGKVE